MKKKLIIIIVILIIFICTLGITYSSFTANANLNIIDQKIAKFVFNSKVQDDISLPLTSITPGFNQDYNFSITNNDTKNISNVTINYQIIIKTFHYLPLEIKLYNNEKLILNCDETFSRNSDNILVCKSTVEEFIHNKKELNNYRLNVIYSEEKNEFIDQVDFIDIEIKSWQKK